MATSTQCTGTTKTGTKCQQKAISGTALCPLHTPGRVRKRKSTRRSFGAIRKLPSGCYQATYRRDGKQHAQTFPEKATLKEVREYLDTIHADIVRGKWVDPVVQDVAFSEYAEDWLASGVKRGRISPTTEAKYRGLLDRHLIKQFGPTHLGDIKSVKIQRWYDDLAAEHPSTAASAYRLLATIFNRAVKDSLLSPSPCNIEGAGRDPRKIRDGATPAECQAAIDAIPEKYRCAIMLGAWGQLRRSEVLGLQRGDIDTSEGTVSIKRAWKVTETGKTTLGPPKSEAGLRTLYMPQHVLNALSAHLDEYVGPEKDAWLFPGTNGKPMIHRTFSRVWTRARTTINRPDLHFHDLRGSGLTWLAQNGATHAELMHRGGHSNVASVMIYQKAAAERDKALAKTLELSAP